MFIKIIANIVVFAVNRVCSERVSMCTVNGARFQSSDETDPSLEDNGFVSVLGGRLSFLTICNKAMPNYETYNLLQPY